MKNGKKKKLANSTRNNLQARKIIMDSLVHRFPRESDQIFTMLSSVYTLVSVASNALNRNDASRRLPGQQAHLSPGGKS